MMFPVSVIRSLKYIFCLSNFLILIKLYFLPVFSKDYFSSIMLNYFYLYKSFATGLS